MTKDNLNNSFLESEELIFVDFYAEWCGPCQTMDPIISEVLADLDGRVKFLKIDLDKHPQVAQQFGIRSIPHYILFQAGEILWRKGGVFTKRELMQDLKRFT